MHQIQVPHAAITSILVVAHVRLTANQSTASTHSLWDPHGPLIAECYIFGPGGHDIELFCCHSAAAAPAAIFNAATATATEAAAS